MPPLDHPKWSTRSTATNIRPGRIPQRMGKCEYNETVLGGLIFKRSKLCPPANEVFTPLEMDRRISELSERFLAEEQRLKEAVRQAYAADKIKNHKRRTESANKQRKARAHMEFYAGLQYDDLKVINCCRCSTVLLGKSHEFIREKAEISRRKFLPPKIAGELNGSPVCEECQAENKK